LEGLFGQIRGRIICNQMCPQKISLIPNSGACCAPTYCVI
jgi:hypothetical protein